LSTPAEVRARAAQIVVLVAERGQSLDGLLAAASGKPQERGLLRSLCYGTLRWHIRLSAILAQVVSGPATRLEPEVRALTLVGLFQLLHTDIAPHAAVSETVNATRVLDEPRAASLVNAVLRRCQREGKALGELVDADPALRTAHPQWFADQLAADWPDDATAILDANNMHPPFWLRVNRQHTTPSDYLDRLQAAGMKASLSPHAPEALLLEEAVDVKSLPEFASGWVSVQDAAAQLAAHVVKPLAGHRVLDACAAPGGKTCHMLELEPGLAEMVAIDASGERLERLQQNLTRLRLKATVLKGDAETPESWWNGEPFDRILIDVPCSATGVIRRHPDIKLLRRAVDIPALAERQGNMLERLWPLVKPGGRLVYASCSVLRAENAAIIEPFLKRHREARDVTASLSVAWPAAGQRYAEREPGRRLMPGEAAMDGFYYACLQKSHG
jgi:16S rRNA (cytosine967-C5)-methyltransferase